MRFHVEPPAWATAETLRRLDRVEQMLREFGREIALIKPLAEILLPEWRWLQTHAVPADEWCWTFCADQWPDQAKEGIDRVLGIEIVWV